MDGKKHMIHTMHLVEGIFQNACIEKRVINVWCSIHAFNVHVLTYVLRLLTLLITEIP